MSELCRIAVVQMRSDTDKKKNLAQSKDYIEEASNKNEEIIRFQEFPLGFSP